MQKIGTFREWLNKKEIENLNEIKDIEYNQTETEFLTEIRDFTRRSIIFNNHIPCAATLEWIKEQQILMNEAVILPQLIEINTYDQYELNKKFIGYNINFIKDDKQSLNGYYDKANDFITIIYSKNDTFEEIEALLGHEMVHKEQHKKTGEYFKQSERIVNQINDMRLKLNKLLKMPGGNLINAKQIKEIQDKMNIMYHNFLYCTPYEKMAYAYQFVHINKNLNPNNIIKKIKTDEFTKEFPITTEFKKYVYMYWVLRNKKINIGE